MDLHYNFLYAKITANQPRKFAMGTINRIERKNGTTSYVAQVRIKGNPRISESFKTEKEAQDYITAKELFIAGGGVVSKTKINNTLLSEIFDDFIQKNKTTTTNSEGKETVFYTSELNKHKEHLINFLKKNIGDLTLETFTHEKIKAIFDYLLTAPVPRRARKEINVMYEGDVVKCYSEATVGKYFSLLREILENFAFIHNYNLGKRFTNHRTFKSWNPRIQRITREDEAKIYEACNTREQTEQFQQLFKLGIHTGMRASELLKLKAINCHLADNKRYIFVSIDTNKMKTSRSVPLSLIARQVLLDNFKEKTPDEIKDGIRVFDKLRVKNLDSMIKRITFSAGNRNIRLGDCRHEFLCRTLEETSIDVVKLALMTGHNLATLIKYASQLRPLTTALLLDEKK